ncbi:MAG: DEAD/DEAH box helicase [Opitutales bacterium]|nr:DEAD/DEAH box helicase [Opitutales bacterium]
MSSKAHPPQFNDAKWKQFLPEQLLSAGKNMIAFVNHVQWSDPILKGSLTDGERKINVELNFEDLEAPVAKCTCGLTEKHPLCKHAIAVYFRYFERMLQAQTAILSAMGDSKESLPVAVPIGANKNINTNLKATSAPIAPRSAAAKKALASLKERFNKSDVKNGKVRSDAKFLQNDRAAAARAKSTQTLANYRPDKPVPAPCVPDAREIEEIRRKIELKERKERKIESDLDFEIYEDHSQNRNQWRKRSTWVRPLTEHEIIYDWVKDPRHYHDVSKTPEHRIIFLNTEFRIKVDGEHDWLMIIAPDVDSFNYNEVIGILKENNFILEEGRWYLNGEHEILNFFSRGWKRLEQIAPSRRSVKFSSIINSILFCNKLSLSFNPLFESDSIELNLAIDTKGSSVLDVERALACSRPYVQNGEGRYVVITQRVIDQLENIKLDLDLDISSSSAESKWTRRLKFRELPVCEAIMRKLGILEDDAGEGAEDGKNEDLLPDYWKKITEPLRNPQMLPPINIPQKLDSMLRPYQRIGAQWLSFLHKNELGGLLADEMGLGKTVESIAFLAADYQDAQIAREIVRQNEENPVPETLDSPEKTEKKVLKSVSKNSDSAENSPALKIVVKKKFLKLQQAAEEQRILRMKKEQRDLARKAAPRSYLIVAPAGLVENWRREIVRFAPKIPVYVHHGNARDQLDLRAFKDGVVLTSYSTLTRDALFFFEREWTIIIADEAQQVKNRQSRNSKTLRDLRAETRFVLTGTPVENSTDDLRTLFEFLLPTYIPKAEHNTRSMPLAEYQERYEHLTRRYAAPYILRRTKDLVAPELPPRIEQLVWCEFDNEQEKLYKSWQKQTREEFDALEQTGANENVLRLTAFAQLMRLRQICTEPRLVDSEFNEENSTKLKAFREIRDEAIEGGHRMLVFSQFVSVLAFIKKALDEDGIRYEYIDGSTQNRTEICDRFNKDASIPICLISLKAGGVGLNLTGADMVIHYDPWWNPAAEAQATDRAHRIGQTRVVTALKLVTANSIEERVLALQMRKRALLDSLFKANQDLGMHISLADIKDLLN